MGQKLYNQKKDIAPHEHCNTSLVDDGQDFRYVGKAILPKNGLEIVTGKTAYADDIQLGNTLHAKILRSPGLFMQGF